MADGFVTERKCRQMSKNGGRFYLAEQGAGIAVPISAPPEFT
jgi:hypothetical protein